MALLISGIATFAQCRKFGPLGEQGGFANLPGCAQPSPSLDAHIRLLAFGVLRAVVRCRLPALAEPVPMAHENWMPAQTAAMR